MSARLQRSNMGNICLRRETPNVSLSCINTGVISSCCRPAPEAEQPSSSAVTLFKWMYSVRSEYAMSFSGEPTREGESLCWHTNYRQCYDDALARISDEYMDDTSIIHLFIFEWEVGCDSAPQLSFHRQMSSLAAKHHAV